jgi:putative transposase
MPNHVHLVIEVTIKGKELSEIMKGINLSYALHYKNKYKHIGHFWQDRFKSIIISKDEYLLACGSYVELNAVRAGIVENPSEYQWCSYKVYANGNKSDIVDKHPIYEDLGTTESQRQKQFRNFIKGILIEKKAMKGAMNRRLVYGSEEFQREIENQYEIESVIRRRGRPIKTPKKGTVLFLSNI